MGGIQNEEMESGASDINGFPCCFCVVIVPYGGNRLHEAQNGKLERHYGKLGYYHKGRNRDCSGRGCHTYCAVK